MSETIEGGCFCGRIRYRLKRRPMFVHCCHCRDCQRQLGSAFVVNGIVEAENVELLQGKPVMVTLSTDSGRPHDVYRCPDCQSALWSDYGRRKWLSFVRLATLDRPSEFPRMSTSTPARNSTGCRCPRAPGFSRPITT